MLKIGEVHHVRYTKVQDVDSRTIVGSTTERDIIPTFVPKANVKALDVTDLSTEDQSKIVGLLEGYRQYLDNLAARTFSFEDWVSHTTGEDISVKWRTFKFDNLEIL